MTAMTAADGTLALRVVLVLYMAGLSLGSVLLAVALWRSRAVPKAVPAGMVVNVSSPRWTCRSPSALGSCCSASAGWRSGCSGPRRDDGDGRRCHVLASPVVTVGRDTVPFRGSTPRR